MEKLKERNTFKYNGNYCHIDLIEYDTHNDVNYAIEFHRKLRGQGQVHSILDDIPGIGPARRKALMKNFVGLDEIKKAEIEDLKKIPSMDEKSARSVYNFFRSDTKDQDESLEKR